MTVHGDKHNAGSVWAIVLMYGREEVTAACIDSLLAQDYPQLTVLLVDNASPNGAGGRMRGRYPGVTYLNTGANLGYAGGNNRGMAHALANGADYVFVLNNDTVLEPSCVTRLVESAKQVTDAGAIAPKILYYDDPKRIWFAGGDYSYLRALGHHRRELELDDANESPRLDEISFVTGCAFLMPTPVVREVGGFREDYFMYCEDVELSLRLRRSGHRMYYQPAARLRHHDERRKGLTAPFATMHRDRNRRRLVREHYSAVQRVMFALWFYPTRAARLLQYILRRDWPGARALVLGLIRP